MTAIKRGRSVDDRRYWLGLLRLDNKACCGDADVTTAIEAAAKKRTMCDTMFASRCVGGEDGEEA